MWLWDLKKSCLPHKEARRTSFDDIEQTEPLSIIDWKWENNQFLVLIYELGWYVCDLEQTPDNEENVRELLQDRWIASQYADMAYFRINMIEKGALET